MKHRIQILLLATVFTGTSLFAGMLQTPSASALSGSQFKAGRIIDDSLFYNGETMTASQVQQFLDAKVPTCDTNGTKIFSGTTTRAEYGASRGYPAPYTCLKSFKQNTPFRAGESGLCSAISAKSGRTAAQIIDDVARACHISQKALIVMLQKEQAIVTDDWPWSIQYRSAMGYGCPDGGAVCDSEYYGFFNQVYNAARQFQRYKADPNNWNHIPRMTNNILYQADMPSCGTKSVYIENYATAALYNYTPYTPNKAALDNLYGSGDSCSAYGNRNFWRYYNDWFGSTIGVSITSVVYDGNTDKTGEQATIGYRLSQKPTSNVILYFAVNSTSNANIIKNSTLTITPNTWNDASKNTVTVAGVNNTHLTDNTYQYWLGPSGSPSSSDLSYNNISRDTVPKVSLVQVNNNSTPSVYRLYNSTIQRHHFTSSKETRDILTNEGWKNEGGFLFCSAGEQTIKRLQLGDESRLVAGGSDVEHQSLVAGFKFSGVEFPSSQYGNIPVYWLYDNSGKKSFYTTSQTEVSNMVSSGTYENKGIAFYACSEDSRPVFRLYRPSNGSHFYATSPSERNSALKSGNYRYENLAYYTIKGNSTIPVYRLYRKSNNAHFYTTSTVERDKIAKSNYRYEGVAFYLSTSSSRDIHRLYRKSNNTHFFTASVAEKSALQNAGFNYEGVPFKAN